MIDVKSRQRQKQCCQGLPCKLGLRPETNDVIHYTHAVDYEYAEEKSKRPRADGNLVTARCILVVGQDDYKSCQSHHWEKTDAAQPWDVCLVNLSYVRVVVETFTPTEPHNLRNNDKPEKYAQAETRQYKYDLLCQKLIHDIML